jgi:hypothetical protein
LNWRCQLSCLSYDRIFLAMQEFFLTDFGYPPFSFSSSHFLSASGNERIFLKRF